MAMSVILPLLTGEAVETINSGARHSHRHESVSHDRHTLLVYALAIIAVVLARWGFTYWRRMIAGRVSLGVEYDLRERLYSQLQRLELGFFDHQQTGQLMSRATVDLPAVRFFLGYGLVFILQFVLTIVLAGIVMIVISPWLGLISLAPAPFVVLISYRYGRRARPAIQEVQQRIAELTADAEENISGVRIVKSFAREPRQLERFRRSVGRTFEQAMVATRLEATYNPAIGFLPQLGIAAVLLLGGNAVIHAHLTLGQFTTFYLLLNMLVGPAALAGSDAQPRSARNSFRRAHLPGTRPRAYDRRPARRPAAAGRQRSRATARSNTALQRPPRRAQRRHLCPGWSRTGRRRRRRAEWTHSTGRREAHRSARPRPRRARGTHGRIGGRHRLGQDQPRGFDLAAVRPGRGRGHARRRRRALGRLAIAALGRGGRQRRSFPVLRERRREHRLCTAGCSSEEIEDAARRAQAHDFVLRLPEGYDTEIGERGLSLSGGQRQRLAIARALLANPRVLILDDATSSVDASTEQSIKLALAEAMTGRTTFVIAHRLSTIALADEIVVLDHGRIVAQGNHEQLLDASELYREIVERGLPEQVFLTTETREREVSGI